MSNATLTNRPLSSPFPLPLRRPALVREPSPDVPAEQQSPVLFGVCVHLGPPAIYIATLALFGIEIVPAAAAFLIISVVNLFVVLGAERAAPSINLPRPTLDDVKEGLALVFIKGVACGGAVVLGGWWLLTQVLPANLAMTGWAPILLAVLLTDAVYYWTHRALNHGKGRHPIMRWFRKNHATHHTVSELDFLRGNISSFFDTAVTGFQLPLAIIAPILGLDLPSTIAAYGLVLMLQATHHVNHTFNLGPLRYFFMDNHAHKLHHCPRGRLVNHGALFSIWDRAFGTFFEDWSLSSNHMSKHRIPVPVRKARPPR